MEIIKNTLDTNITSESCYMNLTNKARKDIEENLGLNKSLIHLKNGKEILKFLLSLQPSYKIHIEKSQGRNEDDLYISLLFDTKENEKISAYIENKTLCLYGVLKEDGLLVIGMKLLPTGLGRENNRRIIKDFHFFINSDMSMPFKPETIAAIQNLPFARERSKFVESRLKSWEIYLDLMINKATNDEVKTSYNSARFTEHLRELNVEVERLREKTAGKNLRGAEVSLIESSDKESTYKIGTVRKFDYANNIVQIELNDDYVEMARKNQWSPKANESIHISNYGGLAQARRLRFGFKALQNGVAKNPNLEYLLFEETPPTNNTNTEKEQFKLQNTVQSNLNPYQIKAVTGAMNAEDIYLIQGPPGTGKTTVIAEICYQNAERGLKTLIASQSNLAVDNALSKLLAHPNIRILRKGRTQSIEEEGKKYIEENIAETWKKQTLDSIRIDLEEIKKSLHIHEDKKIEIEQNILDNTEKLSIFENEKEFRQQLAQNKKDFKKNDKLFEQLKNAEVSHTKSKIDLEKKLNQLSIKLKETRNMIENWDTKNVYEEKKNALNRKVYELKKEISYLKEKNIYEEKSLTFKNTLAQLETSNTKLTNNLITLNELSQKQGKEVLTFINNLENIKSEELLIKKNELNNLFINIKKMIDNPNFLSDEMERFQNLSKNISIVLDRQEKILKQYNYDTELAKTLNQEFDFTPDEIINRLPELSNEMMTFSEPSLLPNLMWKFTKKLPQKITLLLDNYLESLAIQSFINEHLKFIDIQILELKDIEIKFPLLLIELKDLAIKYFNTQHKNLEKSILSLNENKIDLEEELNKNHLLLNHLKEDLLGIEPTKSIDELKNTLISTEHKVIELGSKEEYRIKLTKDKEHYETLYKNASVDFEVTLNILNTTLSKLEILQPILNELKENIDKNQEILNYLDTINAKNEKLLVEEQNVKLNHNLLETKNKISVLSIQENMKTEWANMLEDAKDYDLKEIKKLYIKHANVIGITCVQSAQKSFAEDYPDFDVVIIDEVSKATPPELLLPMLKGKKIILVGDHHQLPPLIGQETIEEVVDNIPEKEEQDKVKKILQESLFERLFKVLPEQNKSTLRIQYRMHEDIMSTITQFYENESTEGIGLLCGLTNSNKDRDHNLNGKYIKRGQHIMWFDLPNEEEFFEQKEIGMTSLSNEAELKIITELLKDLNESVANAKLDGTITNDVIKNVGIISFYGDQVRRLKNIVDNMKFEHLRFRVGTVDRFQGMESDIIFASFVRNHNNAAEDIGFANDYRRLNVALSRAKELLIITGSTKMFTSKAKRFKTRKMYTRVVQEIQNKNGLRDHMGRAK